MKFHLSLIACLLFTGTAMAQTSPDFIIFDAQVAALQQRIDAAGAAGALKPEALDALRGKQKELADQEAKLKQAGSMTSDEKSALEMSISAQKKRLATLRYAAAPAVKRPDPASLPAPTYVAPNGTTISGQNAMPGVQSQQNGVVPLPTLPEAPAAPISPSTTTVSPAQ